MPKGAPFCPECGTLMKFKERDRHFNEKIGELEWEGLIYTCSNKRCPGKGNLRARVIDYRSSLKRFLADFGLAEQAGYGAGFGVCLGDGPS